MNTSIENSLLKRRFSNDSWLLLHLRRAAIMAEKPSRRCAGDAATNVVVKNFFSKLCVHRQCSQCSYSCVETLVILFGMSFTLKVTKRCHTLKTQRQIQRNIWSHSTAQLSSQSKSHQVVWSRELLAKPRPQLLQEVPQHPHNRSWTSVYNK